jgi:ABC-type amino acid transport substrate-binding protein
MRTLIPGTLTILSAYPDPPFDIMKDGTATGFDIELMRAVCDRRLLMQARISTASSRSWLTGSATR